MLEEEDAKMIRLDPSSNTSQKPVSLYSVEFGLVEIVAVAL